MMTDNAETELDASGLMCPLPILRAKKRLKDVPTGGVLRVIATDPAAPRDFVGFAAATGCTLLSNERVGERFVIRLRRD